MIHDAQFTRQEYDASKRGWGHSPLEYAIKDLGSTNKTYVNGEAIATKTLEHDDNIRVGWNNFKFIDETQKDPNKTAKIHKSWIPGVYYTKDD